MYDRFTESARAVMMAANQEAIRVNHQYIGTDDILVGLAVGEANLATQVIASHVNVETIRRTLAEMPKTEGDAKTPRAKKVVENAMSEARRLFHLHVGPEHLLLGLLQDASSDASRALSELGIDLDQLKSEILSQLPPSFREVLQERDAIRMRKLMHTRFADHPDVKDLEREIDGFQLLLEEAVTAGKFDVAASFRDERLSVEQTLSELYRKLSQD